jgi:hypothetical protein
LILDRRSSHPVQQVSQRSPAPTAGDDFPKDRRCASKPIEGQNRISELNRAAFDFAKELIVREHFVFDETDAWSEHRPSAPS